MILWAAGLQVSMAWTISTETDSALKKGNYVQGTVLLVLRKREVADGRGLGGFPHKRPVQEAVKVEPQLPMDILGVYWLQPV